MVRYDNDFLVNFCKENGLELRKNYENEIVGVKTVIIAKCIKCDENMKEKELYALVKNKIFNCIKCDKESYKNPKLNIYNLDYLTNFCRENKIELLKDYSNEYVTRSTIIIAKCIIQGCDTKMVEKQFSALLYSKRFECKTHHEEITTKKIKNTNMEKFGVEVSLQNKEIYEKMQNTVIERYGVKHINQNESVKQKRKATILERFGVEYASQNEDVKRRFKETCMERYGYENPSMVTEFKDKRKATILDRFGVEYASQNEEIKQRIKDYWLEKYGVGCCLQNPNITEKSNITNIERYGSTNPMLCEIVKNKIQNTNLHRYGVRCVLENKEIQQTIRDTCLEKYGHEYYSQTDEFNEQVKNTNLERRGVEHHSQTKEFNEQVKKTNMARYGCEYYTQTEEYLIEVKKTNMEKYGVEFVMQVPEIAEKILRNSFKPKIYIYPSGNEALVQGYEPYALDILIHDEKIDENFISTKRTEVPAIWWLDSENKKHRYYVDIFIKNENRCIEVKSPWTFDLGGEEVFLKQNAVKDAGYQCEIWILNKKKLIKKYF